MEDGVAPNKPGRKTGLGLAVGLTPKEGDVLFLPL